VAAVNGQLSRVVYAPRTRSLLPRVALAAFTDAAWGTLDVPGADGRFFGDAGLGAAFSGTLYDRSYSVRVDFPLWTRDAVRGSDEGSVHWVFSLGELF